MSENVPYNLWNRGGSTESAPSFSNIDVISTSNLSDYFDATTSTTAAVAAATNNNNTNASIMDDYTGEICSSDQNIEGGLLEDIFKVLSEVTLHATEALHDYCPNNLEASTSKNEECFMQEKRGIESHYYTNIVAQASQTDEGVEAKEDIPPMVHEPTHRVPYDENHDQLPTRKRKRERKRREQISTKLRILQTLLPPSHKKDHASILDNAVGYIKFLKLQILMLSRAIAIGQSEHYASYNSQMMTGGTGRTHWPFHFPMAQLSNYSLMNQPNFSVRPISEFPVAQLQTILPVLLPPQPSMPIRLHPSIPYIGLSNSSTGLATSPSTMEQSNI